jgi:hypothetical protein
MAEPPREIVVRADVEVELDLCEPGPTAMLLMKGYQ